MTLGEALSSIRQEYGVSVDELSRATRIRASLIRQIEADDFSGCGGDIYARGHLRAIATYLDLDPEPLIKQYDRKYSRGDAPAPAEVFEQTVAASKHRTGPNWTAGMAVAAGILLLIAVMSIVNPNRTPSQTVTERQPSTAVTSESAAPSVNTDVPNTVPDDAIAGLLNTAGTSIKVRIIGDKCWVHATSGGVNLFVGTLTKGKVQDITADGPIHLVLGNAGAVALTVNGVDIGSPGANGSVVNLDFGPDDPDGAGSG